MRVFLISFLALFSSVSGAQNYSEGDLYRLLNQIEQQLDQITPTNAQVQDVAAALENAKAALATGGAPTANLTISDGATYNFGLVAVGSSTDKTFIVSNTGLGHASHLSAGGLALPFRFKGGSYPGTGGTCARVLNSSNSCTFVLTFEPNASGTFSDSIDLNYHDGMNGQSSSRPIQGTAVSPALLTISGGPAYDFGKVAAGTFAETTLILTNSGSFTATGITSQNLTLPFSYFGGRYPGAGGTCGRTLSGGASCTIVVRYSPAVAGTDATTVNVLYSNGTSSQSTTRGLLGSGI